MILAVVDDREVTGNIIIKLQKNGKEISVILKDGHFGFVPYEVVHFDSCEPMTKIQTLDIGEI